MSDPIYDSALAPYRWLKRIGGTILLGIVINFTYDALRSTTSDVQNTPGLEGIWAQYDHKVRHLGNFRVTQNFLTGQYSMRHHSAPSPGVLPSRGITNIRFDGFVWSFDSDWGHKVWKFTLGKKKEGEFVGYVDGQLSIWIKLNRSGL